MSMNIVMFILIYANISRNMIQIFILKPNLLHKIIVIDTPYNGFFYLLQLPFDNTCSISWSIATKNVFR